MKFIFAFTALVFVLTCSAQKDTTGGTPVDTNSVHIHKDPRLDLLINKQAQINEVTTIGSRKTAKGYRLMVISTNKRDEAFAAKSKVLTYFPDLKAYMWYQSPYFKVKAGNFKERDEAESYRKRMNVYFPKGVFIMPDIIEVKPPKNNQPEDNYP